MIHIATKEKARELNDKSLRALVAGECTGCAIIAHLVLKERSRTSSARGLGRLDNAEQSTGQGQFVHSKPKVRTPHDLSFLIRDKSGESAPVVVKDVDSKALHDILDRADEIVISRVDVK